MEVKELKFLLKLIGKENYQGKIGDLKPNSKTKASENNSICRGLGDRQFVEFSESITKFKITAAGKALLKLDTDNLPVSADELKILKACATETITPGKTKVTPADKRTKLIENLVERGLIAATEKKIEQVRLSETGKEYLAKEYQANGSATISLNLLNNYLRFLRKYPRFDQTTTNGTSNGNKTEIAANHHNGNGKQHQTATNGKDSNGKKPSDAEILQTIIDLDSELGTDNYLPIFHLRQKLSSLSRKELDKALYRLQQQDKLELSSLVEAVHYSKEQVEAGIPQNVGGCLFFLIVN